ncbi:MAG: glycoside hydrolase family 88 protein [Bifidobacteriaceae bacterium]|jgi:unsaturated chondroitin disaccharide hydrolase|nr:glycoside hydrolase family 88 protein [Bifidobacteriaceae bacterium]
MTTPATTDTCQADLARPPVPDPLAAATSQAVATVRRGIEEFGPRFPGDCSVDGRYRNREDGAEPGANTGWTTGFRTGLIWLANELSPDPAFAEAGAQDVESFTRRLDSRSGLDTHDLGFLYMPSCVAAWRVARSPQGFAAALGAAQALMERFVEPAGIFQAWGALDDANQHGRAIIDSAMNMPLLYWASRETRDGQYSDAAVRHIRQLRDHLVRADNSTFHTFAWHTGTGAPLSGATAQGYSDSSCWARGQAWAVYGFALSFRWTGDPTFLDAAQRCADHYLEHLPADRIPYWDLVFQDDSCGQPRDSSAAAIASCGLLELADLASTAEDRQRYREAALAAVAALVDGYVPDAATRPNAQLLHGVYDIPSRTGIDEANLWGDYFYVEALTRLARPTWTPYWLTGLEIQA